jgi:VanZ family protein
LSTSEPWRHPRPAPNFDDVRHRVPRQPIAPQWLRSWWPAILWACLIFTASTDSFSSDNTASVLYPMLHAVIPHLTTAQFQVIHHFIRKSAHFSEYFIFYLVLFRGIRGSHSGWRWTWAWTAWFVAAAYSALDEIHQSFVASRTASAWDSLLDSIGALVALAIVYLFYRHFRSRPSTLGHRGAEL